MPWAQPTAGTDLSAGLRFADLFAGIGGFHLALREVGARCVFAAENDPHARRCYSTNHQTDSPEVFTSSQFAGDITKVETTSIPDFDVLCAGFPCQAFSEAGKRRGFSDPRGVLFFEIARLLRDKRPAAFILENVRGLLSHDGGRTLRIICHVLTAKLGYSLEYRVLRACDYGLPQLRPRLYLVGFADSSMRMKWPEPVPLSFTLDDVFGGSSDQKVSRTILATGYGKLPGQKFNWDAYVVDGQIRRLTPHLSLRLQGFPPDFVLPPQQAHAARLVGNAVAVPVAAAVARGVAAAISHDVDELI